MLARYSSCKPLLSSRGDKLASQGSAITELQNTAQNGKAKYWLTKIFDIKVSGSEYIPSCQTCPVFHRWPYPRWPTPRSWIS